MKKSLRGFQVFRCVAIAVGVFLDSAMAGAGVSARTLLGVGDTTETVWDRGVIARGAQIAAVEPALDGSDSMCPGDRWRMRTCHGFGTASRF
jgi:hypothetical protein